MRISKMLLLMVLGASGQWCSMAVVPPASNAVVLAWDSIGPGTQYYVQTSTDFLTWTTATNTTATNVSLAFIGDKSRTFRVSASNAPLQAATLAWDFGIPAGDVAGYFIYYGVNMRSYTNRVDAGLGASGVVPNLKAGTTYYFAMTAYTSSGLESDYSNEAVWQCALRLKLQHLP